MDGSKLLPWLFPPALFYTHRLPTHLFNPCYENWKHSWFLNGWKMPQKGNRYCEISMKLLPCLYQLNEIKPGNCEDFYLLKDTVFSEHFVKATYFVKDLSKSQWSALVPLSLHLWTPRIILKCLVEQSCWLMLLGAFACRVSCRAQTWVHRAAANVGKPPALGSTSQPNSM